MTKYKFEYMLRSMSAYYDGQCEISVYTDNLQEAEAAAYRYVKNTMPTYGLTIEIRNLHKI